MKTGGKWKNPVRKISIIQKEPRWKWTQNDKYVLEKIWSPMILNRCLLLTHHSKQLVKTLQNWLENGSLIALFLIQICKLFLGNFHKENIQNWVNCWRNTKARQAQDVRQKEIKNIKAIAILLFKAFMGLFRFC